MHLMYCITSYIKLYVCCLRYCDPKILIQIPVNVVNVKTRLEPV